MQPAAPSNAREQRPDLLKCSQWDKVENKTAVILYGAGAVVLLWFSNTLVGALNSVPLVSLNLAPSTTSPQII
jgi:hypothetical protein